MNPPAHVKPIGSVGRLLHCWGDWRDYDWLIVTGTMEDTVSWEIGDGAGVYILTDIKVDRSAELNIRVNDRAFLGEKIDPLHAAMIDYLIDKFNLVRLASRISATNRGTIRFSKRLGFEYEGMLRQAGVVDGQPSDVWLGAIIRNTQHARF